MAQVTDTSLDSLTAKNESVSVIQTGNTNVLQIPCERITEVGIAVVVAGQALDAFIVQGKFHRDGSLVTLYSAAGAYTSPAGLIVAASGDLTVQAVGTGWLIVDVRPLYELAILTSSGNVAGSTVSMYATGRK